MSRPSAVAPRPPCRLYLITPPAIGDLTGFARTLEAGLAGGDVAAVQVRLKDLGDAAVLDAVAALRPIVHAAGAALILNDRPDLAARSGCDGVHVGQSDASVKDARRIMGPDAMIGATCHDSLHLAMEAAEAGADYVAFGAFFPTRTKVTTHRPDPEILSIWQAAMEIPCVAIGGVDLDNVADLARVGADFAAVSSAVWDHPDGPAEAVRSFNQRLAEAF